MQAWHYRFASTALAAVALLTACGGNTEQGREEAAAREFRQRLAQNRADLIYESASGSLRQSVKEAEFRKRLFQAQVLGVLEQTERAHFARTKVPGEPDLILTYYNTRFAKGSCLESFSWRTEGNSFKLVAYSCAPNMQVKCSADTQCETSPVPTPGFAGD
jgi:hypothetical protein